MARVGDVAGFLQDFAPASLAADWDNVGLLLGDAAAPVERLLTCLTLTPPVVDEALRRGVQAIVSHHPIFFKPARRLTTDSAEGRLLLPLVRDGVAVLSPHTAFDNTCGGINDLLAMRLELKNVRPLRPLEAVRQCKVVVFVPEADLDRVSAALFQAGAGIIGQYSQCSFRLEGVGTFFGSEAAHPAVGQKGRREEVREWRLEVLCPEAKVQNAIQAVRSAHSYEEPAYDVYPLLPGQAPVGVGRIGQLARPVALAEWAKHVKELLAARGVQVVGDGRLQVQRVALACGAAGEMWRDAWNQGADVFLTGEMRFHEVLAAQASNLGLVLPGHYATERCGIEDLAQRLARAFPHLEVWPSQAEDDPLTWV